MIIAFPVSFLVPALCGSLVPTLCVGTLFFSTLYVTGVTRSVKDRRSDAERRNERESRHSTFYSSGFSFREKNDTRFSGFPAGLEVFAQQSAFFRGIDQTVIEIPGFEDWFRKGERGVTRQRVLVEIAAVTDNREQRKLIIVQDVAQRIARFKQAGTLNHHNRSGSAQIQPAGDCPGFSLTANSNQSNRFAGTQCSFPLAQRAVRQPDHMRNLRIDQKFDDIVTGKHGGSRLERPDNLERLLKRPSASLLARRAEFQCRDPDERTSLLIEPVFPSQTVRSRHPPKHQRPGDLSIGKRDRKRVGIYPLLH